MVKALTQLSNCVTLQNTPNKPSGSFVTELLET